MVFDTIEEGAVPSSAAKGFKTMREEARTRVSTRTRLWKEQDKVCVYCQRKITLELASLDHIIPIDLMDGMLYPENLIVCCKRCNKAKGNSIIFYNLYDGCFYPVIDTPAIFRDYFIHNTKKIRK